MSSYNPDEKYIYFIAVASGDIKIILGKEINRNMLIALNQIDKDALQMIKSSEAHILIDSGVYSLVSALSKKKQIPIADAFRIPFENIPEHEKYLENYIRIIREIEDYVWGYIEIDLGDYKSKAKTREAIEKAGLHPIPVFHPFSDPFSYYQELAEKYDRVGIGNLAYGKDKERKIIFSRVLMHRKETGRPLWIHALGVTPNNTLYCLPMESCDSSAWISSRKFGSFNTFAGGSGFGDLGKDYIYKIGTEAYKSALLAGIYDSVFIEKNWRDYELSLSKER